MKDLPKRTATLSWEQPDPFKRTAVPGLLGDVNQHQDTGLEPERRHDALMAVRAAIRTETLREDGVARPTRAAWEIEAVDDAVYRAANDCRYYSRHLQWAAYLSCLERNLAGNLDVYFTLNPLGR